MATKEQIMRELARRELARREQAEQGQAQPKQQAAPVDFSARTMMQNVPSSAYKFAKDMVYPFMHPVQTAKAVGNLAAGTGVKGAQAITPPSVSGPLKALSKGMLDKGYSGVDLTGKEAYADQFAKFVSDRYGSMDAFKKTATEDPVGVFADAASILTLGGATAAKLPGTAGKVGRGIAKAGVALDPVNIAKTPFKAVGKGMVKAISKAKSPQELYESAAKFPTTKTEKEVRELATTALDYKVMPTKKGVERLKAAIQTYDDKVEEMIALADSNGVTIPKDAVFKNLNELRQRVAGTKLHGAKKLKKIDKVAKEFDEHMKAIGKDSFTPSELQAFKRDIYDDISWDTQNKITKNRIGQQIDKSIARAAREAIENIADVGDLNRELGRLLSLEKPLTKATRRIANRDLTSLGAPLKIGVGSLIGGKVGTGIAVGLAMFDNPKIKARLAIKLHQIQKAGNLEKIDPKLWPVLARLGLVQSGRLTNAFEIMQEESNEQ